jgi:hypothetical protein
MDLWHIELELAQRNNSKQVGLFTDPACLLWCKVKKKFALTPISYSWSLVIKEPHLGGGNYFETA